jgi:hypothetical protein
MPRPFKGTIELDIRDSVPDWDAFLPDKAPVRRTSWSCSTTSSVTWLRRRSGIEQKDRVMSYEPKRV